MSLKTAALVAFVGTILAAVLGVASFIRDVVSAVQGLIPLVTVVTSLIYAFAAVSAALFFYVFQKRPG